MTWEELNKKYDYDFNRLILCMPNDVRKDITKAWGGGALHPYNAADYVLEERKLLGIEVDLDVVAKKYEEKFLRKPHDRKEAKEQVVQVKDMKFYVFTFGCAHPLHNMLQGVYATSEMKAREVMIEFYGTKPWCGCYQVREPTPEERNGSVQVSLQGDVYRMIDTILNEGDEYK